MVRWFKTLQNTPSRSPRLCLVRHSRYEVARKRQVSASGVSAPWIFGIRRFRTACSHAVRLRIVCFRTLRFSTVQFIHWALKLEFGVMVKISVTFLFVCRSFFIYFFLSFFLSFFPSFFIYLFLSLFLCLFVCLFVCLFLSFFFSIFLFFFLSFVLSFPPEMHPFSDLPRTPFPPTTLTLIRVIPIESF